MELIVQTPEGEDDSHGESRFSIEDGVLTVYSEERRRMIYSPTFWQRVVVEEPTSNDR